MDLIMVVRHTHKHGEDVYLFRLKADQFTPQMGIHFAQQNGIVFEPELDEELDVVYVYGVDEIPYAKE
jgi:hypothetical protein